MTTQSLVAPHRVQGLDRRRQALTLRRDGLTYERIGERLGISRQAAHELVMRGMTDLRREAVADGHALRQLELDRLDDYMRVLHHRLQDPKNAHPERTVAGLVRISEQRSKLLGLHAPTKMQFEPPPPESSALDLEKLSLEQLIQLEAILETGQVAKRVEPARLGAGDGIV